MKTYTEEEALNRIASLCSTSEHCLSEVTDKLKRWQISSNAAERIIAYLFKEKFIDESRYAKAFVRNKYRFAKWGTIKISQALRLKQINPADIRMALDEINRNEYFAILKTLLQTKQKNIRAKSTYEFTGKLIRYGLSRGFDLNDIQHVLEDNTTFSITIE
jgi:regulatory protein